MQLLLGMLLDGLVYGMLLFMLASGLTLIFSMMGVLNFAHASIYMLGAYFAYTVSHFVSFWAGPGDRTAALRGDRRRHRDLGVAACSPQRPYRRVAVHLRAGIHHPTPGDDGVGTLTMPYRVPAVLDFPLFNIYGQHFPAYRGFMLLVSAGMLLSIWLLLKKTRIGLIIQASLTHPNMVSALGHNVPMVFTIVFAGGCLLAGLAGVIGGNYLTTDSGMADALGPIVFVVVVFGGLGSLAGCFIASIVMGMVQTFAVMVNGSIADLFAPLGLVLGGDTLFGEM